MSEPVMVDATGLACPVPVVRVKRAIDGIAEGTVVALVDDAAARENVSRLAAHLGCACVWEADGAGWRLTIRKPPAAGEQA